MGASKEELGHIDERNCRLCEPEPNEISKTVLGGVEKTSFIALPSKGGTQRTQALKTVSPNRGEGGAGGLVRSFILMV